jgi:hypothetical protein
MRFLARLILIPLGIALAAIFALAFIGTAVTLRPELASGLTAAAEQSAAMIRRWMTDGAEVIPLIELFVTLLSRFVIAVLFAPVILTALAAEIGGFRSWFFHAVVTALLTAAIPFAVMPELFGGAVPALMSLPTALLATTGAVAGTIYWIIAGRSAGADPPTVEERATVKAPKPAKR